MVEQTTGKVGEKNIILNVIKKRRSIREYTSRKIPESAIMKILEAGHYAPNPKNSLPWIFVVIKNQNLINKIMTAKTPDRPEGNNIMQYKTTKDKANFPRVIIAIFFEKKRSIFKDSKYYGKHNKKGFYNINGFSYSEICGIGCALQNMALAAESLGLGSCITADLLEYGISDWLYKELNMDRQKYKLIGGIRLGYPSKTKPLFFRTPLKNHLRFI